MNFQCGVGIQLTALEFVPILKQRSQILQDKSLIKSNQNHNSKHSQWNFNKTSIELNELIYDFFIHIHIFHYCSKF